MKKIDIQIFVIIFLLTVSFVTSTHAKSTLPSAPYVLPQTVWDWQQQNKKVTIVDVREPAEYKAGHIPRAINIPYLEVEKRQRRIGKKRPAVFYCIYSAWRAPYAANTLADLGYTNVYILQGGISAWNAGGQVIMPIPVAPYNHDQPAPLCHPADRQYLQKVYLTLEELSKFNGEDGQPAYVAVEGVIYDVTESRLWRGGVHAPSKGEATAGRDLTEVIKLAPHGKDHLARFPVVGWLQDIK